MSLSHLPGPLLSPTENLESTLLYNLFVKFDRVKEGRLTRQMCRYLPLLITRIESKSSSWDILVIGSFVCQETAYVVVAYVVTAPAATRTDGVAGIETRSWKTDIDRLPAYATSCSAYTTRMHVSVCGYRNDCLRWYIA